MSFLYVSTMYHCVLILNSRELNICFVNVSNNLIMMFLYIIRSSLEWWRLLVDCESHDGVGKPTDSPNCCIYDTFSTSWLVLPLLVIRAPCNSSLRASSCQFLQKYEIEATETAVPRTNYNFAYPPVSCSRLASHTQRTCYRDMVIIGGTTAGESAGQSTKFTELLFNLEVQSN